ncbi:hypothetical protein ACX9MO_00730 [Pseudooceanicola sp. 502str34]
MRQPVVRRPVVNRAAIAPPLVKALPTSALLALLLAQPISVQAQPIPADPNARCAAFYRALTRFDGATPAFSLPREEAQRLARLFATRTQAPDRSLTQRQLAIERDLRRLSGATEGPVFERLDRIAGDCAARLTRE